MIRYAAQSAVSLVLCFMFEFADETNIEVEFSRVLGDEVSYQVPGKWQLMYLHCSGKETHVTQWSPLNLARTAWRCSSSSSRVVVDIGGACLLSVLMLAAAVVARRVTSIAERTTGILERMGSLHRNSNVYQTLQ